jgi:hypothetical protein
MTDLHGSAWSGNEPSARAEPPGMRRGSRARWPFGVGAAFSGGVGCGRCGPPEPMRSAIRAIPVADVRQPAAMKPAAHRRRIRRNVRPEAGDGSYLSVRHEGRSSRLRNTNSFADPSDAQSNDRRFALVNAFIIRHRVCPEPRIRPRAAQHAVGSQRRRDNQPCRPEWDTRPRTLPSVCGFPSVASTGPHGSGKRWASRPIAGRPGVRHDARPCSRPECCVSKFR